LPDPYLGPAREANTIIFVRKKKKDKIFMEQWYERKGFIERSAFSQSNTASAYS